MQRGFPLPLLTRLRCSNDGGVLRAAAEGPDRFLADGTVHCESCGRAFPVRQGVLSLLDEARLHAESAVEMQVRDVRSRALAEGERREWRSHFADATEVEPTLTAVGAEAGMTVCELGCGPGRYTTALAARAAAVVAVDVSRIGLLVLRDKLEAEAQVALVHADVAAPYGAPQAFDRVLSTLHSNLADGAHRARTLRLMADSLTDQGRVVVSMHHYSTRDLVERTPRGGRYPDSGIYRYHMTPRESGVELAPWFSSVRHQFIAARVPGLRSVRLARAVAGLPILRRTFSSLLLALAERPIRHDGAAG